MSKRKAYHPRAARIDALTLAIQGQAKLTQADQEAMAAPVKLAVEQISKGLGAGSASTRHGLPPPGG